MMLAILRAAELVYVARHGPALGDPATIPEPPHAAAGLSEGSTRPEEVHRPCSAVDDQKVLSGMPARPAAADVSGITLLPLDALGVPRGAETVVPALTK